LHGLPRDAAATVALMRIRQQFFRFSSIIATFSRLLRQGSASVSLTGAQGLIELRSLYESCGLKSAFQESVAVQREELEQEITGLREEAERVAEEARELAGEVPF